MTLSYHDAIEWIAENDDLDLGSERYGWNLTICLVADLVGMTDAAVAAEVQALRDKAGAA
jgi:hypothetical protein